MSTPITEVLPVPNIYYQSTGPAYWVEDSTARWIGVNESSVRLRLRAAGFSTEIRAGMNNQVDECLLRIQDSQNISYAGSLAGYRAGLHEIHRRQVLVTESPRLIQPALGDWPLLQGIIDGMLDDPQWDQRPYLYGWLKQAMESFRTGRWTPGQVVAMAGPVNSCKSLLQAMFTEMFGGRAAKPYLYMTGRTNFNADLFGAEHLMVEDEAESRDIRARRNFGSRIKEVAVNRDHHCHGKGKQALTLTPIWRMTISLNDEPERLLVLPPLDSDVADKLMLFKVRPYQLPMPTETAEEKARLWNALVAELPAFMEFLDRFQIPGGLRSRRFGVTHFHHPDLVEALTEMSPEARLLELIDAAFFNGDLPLNEWQGSASDLGDILCHGTARRHREADQLLSYSNSCGIYLHRLANVEEGGRVSGRHLNGRQIWTIRPPEAEPEQPAV